ncbi:MAG: twitching motility protein PilT [Cyanobacteria bacterium 13_1_20CM_4_61_6]|nr:MAG: twitching motility protein PilT [Cyanobacteria bacterium 13_1_20CM_4_61_6]
MPSRIFVDTSFVLALINERDQYHDQAEAFSYRFENSPLIITDAVLLEIGNALAKDFREEAVAIIKVLRNSKRVEVVEIDAGLFEQGLEVYEQYNDKTWGLVDCISFVVMRENEVTGVLTFDGDFTQAGFSVVSG